MKIAHIVNVIELREEHETSYLHIAQPITIQSMVDAKAKTQNCEVQLFAIKNKFDNIKLPPEFNFTDDLERCCYDIADSLPKEKSLPLIGDILSSLFNVSDADYFIYTNIDIGILPDFYNFINKKIKSGVDALCINRRDMPKYINEKKIDINNFKILFSKKGEYHSGADCFVFRRESFMKMNLGNVFIGAPPIGSVLLNQVKKTSNNFRWINREYQIENILNGDENFEQLLTFHIGSDKNWQQENNPYWSENIKQAKRIGYHFNNYLK